MKASVGQTRRTYKGLVVNAERKIHSDDLDVDGRIKYVLQTQVWKVWNGLSWLSIETGGELY
jgi:hypothetical protein